MLHWTDEVRKRVQPRRVEDLPARGKPRSAKTYFRAVQKKFQNTRFAREKMGDSEGELTPHVKAARDMLLAEPPEGAVPVEVLACMWSMTNASGTSGLSRWLDLSFGLDVAIDSWVRAAHFGIPKPWPKPNEMRLVMRDDPGAPTNESWFREALIRAPADVYERARDHAGPLFEAGDYAVRLMLVERFPNEAEWVHALGEQYLNHSSTWHEWRVVPTLQGAVTDPDLAWRLLDRAGPGKGDLETVLWNFGDEAVPWLFELAGRAKQAHEVARIARVLSVVDDPRVAELYAEHLGKKTVRTWAIDWFARFPQHAHVLEPVAEGRNRVAKMAAGLLEQCQRMRASAPPVGPEAAEDELPTVLVSPPWHSPVPKRRAIVVKEKIALVAPVVIHAVPKSQMRLPEGELTGEQARVWRANVAAARAKKSSGRRPSWLLQDRTPSGMARVPLKAVLAEWNAGWPFWINRGDVDHLLAVAGERALSGVALWLDRVSRQARGWHAFGTVRNVEYAALAPPLAMSFPKNVLMRTFAKQWMRRFPEAAIAGLLPAAVGKRCKRRTLCERALRWLASADPAAEARMRERAVELGERVEKSLDEILGRDPIYDFPKKLKPLRRFRPEAVTRPRLANGKHLPLTALQHLAEMLAFTLPDETYVGIEQVKRACNDRDLAELSWELASSWETNGGDGSEWMYFSLVHLADEEVVRRTTPALKNAMIVDVLGHIGTDAAVMELATIAYRGAERGNSYSTAGNAAERALDRIAAGRGLTRDDLDDQLTPTLGLAAVGSLELDYGSRSFEVGFDQHLSPFVIDSRGDRRPRLPRGAKKDDPEKIARAKLAWDELREDVSTIALFRIDALERAMLSGRRWSLDDFIRHWAEHPLLRHLARRLVWAGTDGEGLDSTFRVAEDGSWADAHDEPLGRSDIEAVSVPHPARWPDDTLKKWATVFDDYELIQPIVQLGRPRPRVTDEELATARLARISNVPRALPGIRRGLRERGWSEEGRPALKLDEKRRLVLHMREVWKKSKRVGIRFEVRLEPWKDATLAEVPRKTLLDLFDELGVPEP